MAARLALPSSRTLLVASSTLAAATAVAYPWQKARADEGPSSTSSTPVAAQFASVPAPAATRLSIYDTPSDPLILVPEQPSALQKQVSSIRKTSEVLYNDSKVKLRQVSNDWIGLERKVESEVKSIVSAEEQLSPGILYVGISTLAGSIITRNRSFPIRFLAPPIFLIGSSAYFLPKTTHNLGLYTSELERTYVPGLYDFQKKLTDSIHDSLVSASQFLKSSEATAKQWSEDGRKKLEETSGLSLQSKKSSKE